MSDSKYEDEDYFVPLVDQRVFGAGIKRKRVAFVPATSENCACPTQTTTKQNAGDRYLSIVLKTESPLLKTADKKNQAEFTAQASEAFSALCHICGQRIGKHNEENLPHESSIAHQLCLEHSHPPSHLDRSRAGLKYLQEYGWDPDARLGLGARSEGIRIPVKAKEKKDSAGLGMGYDAEEAVHKARAAKHIKVEDKVTRLNAKEVRKMEDEKGKRAEKLRSHIYGPDLSQYLDPNS